MPDPATTGDTDTSDDKPANGNVLSRIKKGNVTQAQVDELKVLANPPSTVAQLNAAIDGLVVGQPISDDQHKVISKLLKDLK